MVRIAIAAEEEVAVIMISGIIRIVVVQNVTSRATKVMKVRKVTIRTVSGIRFDDEACRSEEYWITIFVSTLEKYGWKYCCMNTRD